jgi:hypothetical protein
MDNNQESLVAKLKAQAKILRAHLAEQGVAWTHSQCLETIARVHGHKDWNTASAFAVEETSKLALLKKQRDQLWMLLDDIDTLSDVCKNDYKGFAERVYSLQRKRYSILEGDEVNPGNTSILLRPEWEPVVIIVNGRQHSVSKPEFTYEEIVQIAFPGVPSTAFPSMTCHTRRRDFCVSPGNRVATESLMVLNVAFTGNA